jgi:NADH-quinone oxidoreductase subunit N
MNASLLNLEFGVLVLALGVLLLDLWLPAESKRNLGYLAAIATALILVSSFVWPPFHVKYAIGAVSFHLPESAFGNSYVMDNLALFFKRFFLLAAVIVLLMSVEFSERIGAGTSEFYSLILFALSGMMLAASANDFAMLFVSIELITVTFYVLTSFQRNSLFSLEAGVKYLILGALASAFMVYGIALIYGSSGTMSFGELALKGAALKDKPVFLIGVLLVVAGLAFKIAAFPLQIWAPDVYQGSPAPATAFLAVGSKAAGIILLIRVLFGALPFEITLHWHKLIMAMSAVTILYGSLCAIPQRNLKRLLGYSSIANAGYLLLGLATMSHAGTTAVLYYLGGYLFAVLGAFTVICVVMRSADAEDISTLAGLNRRSPLLAVTMTLAMVSLAGIPPLAGFFGKFLVFKAAAEQGVTYYWLIGVAIVGVVISLYYYLGVVRAIYWSQEPADLSPIAVSAPLKISLAACIAGMLYLGLFPNTFMKCVSGTVTMIR